MRNHSRGVPRVGGGGVTPPEPVPGAERTWHTIRALVAAEMLLGVGWVIAAAIHPAADALLGMPVGWASWLVGPGEIQMLILGPAMIGAAMLARVGIEYGDRRLTWGLALTAIANVFASVVGAVLMSDTIITVAPLSPWPVERGGLFLLVLVVLWAAPVPLALAHGLAAVLTWKRHTPRAA